MWNDLLLNLLAEGLGIVATYVVIDQLLKRREEKRWLPAKNLLYAKLFEIANDFLVHFIPAEYWKIKVVTYYFGKSEVMVGIEVNDKLLPELIENNFGLADSFTEKGFTDIESLETLKNKVKDILSNSIELIEPELLSQLLDLENSLAFLLKLDEMSKSNANDGITEDVLKKPIVTVSLIKHWLLSKVSRKINQEEYFQEMAATRKDIQANKSELLSRIKSRRAKTG